MSLKQIKILFYSLFAGDILSGIIIGVFLGVLPGIVVSAVLLILNITVYAIILKIQNIKEQNNGHSTKSGDI